MATRKIVLSDKEICDAIGSVTAEAVQAKYGITNPKIEINLGFTEDSKLVAKVTVETIGPMVAIDGSDDGVTH